MKLVGGDEVCAVFSRRLDFLRARASIRPQTDLENLADMRHFGSPADRAGEPPAHAVHLFAPVDVLVDLN